jgi:hypothetical protein
LFTGVLYMGVKLGPSHWTRNVGCENGVLRRIFGPERDEGNRGVEKTT